jgi:hypothetical protein
MTQTQLVLPLELVTAPPPITAAEYFGGIITTYTRAQAIDDGVLVDVSETACEAGFTVPVALTAGVWACICAIPRRFHGIQSVEGRLWDVLWMGACAARRAKDEDILQYDLIMHHGRKTYFRLKMIIGPGDGAEPVVTILLPDED